MSSSRVYDVNARPLIHFDNRATQRTRESLVSNRFDIDHHHGSFDVFRKMIVIRLGSPAVFRRIEAACSLAAANNAHMTESAAWLLIENAHVDFYHPLRTLPMIRVLL